MFPYKSNNDLNEVKFSEGSRLEDWKAQLSCVSNFYWTIKTYGSRVVHFRTLNEKVGSDSWPFSARLK